MTGLARAAGLVSVATLVSRVFGLLRDSVRAAIFAASALSDALNVAFLVPNLLRDLFAEGAFSGAFVPTFAATRESHGSNAAFALLNRVLSTMLVYVGGLVVLVIAAAPAIVRGVAAPEFVGDTELFDTTVLLLRVLAPFLLFICLAVAAMGALNVCGRFFVPALSPAIQNVVLVVGGVVVYRLTVGPVEAALPWAFLLLAGGLLQFIVQVPSLLREGWRPRFSPDLRLKTPEARTIVRRMVPVVAGLAAAHVSILINTRLATADVGGPSNLYYAFRLIHLPVGLVGVAVGTAVLADASRRAARRDEEGLRETLAEAVLLCLAFAAPAAAGLFILAEPVARLIYLWGEEMTAEGVAAIAETIRWYAPAVVFYATVKVVVPIFYAQGRVRIPLVASLVAVLANLACALSLHPTLRWNGLALAVAVGQMANLAVLFGALGAVHGWPRPAILARVAKILLATVACAAAAWGTALLLPEGSGFGARLSRGLLPVVAGGAVYFGSGWLLGCPEVISVMRGLRRLDRGRNRE